MNKLTKELLLKAGGNPNYKAFRGHFLPPPPDYIDPATVDLEKFAELIVREAASIVSSASLTKDGHTWRSANYVVLEHFGVER